MIKAVYPGTFDPLTRGHEDLVRRASTLFDTIILGIADSKAKRPYFSVDERIAMTGSGACVFAEFATEAEARAIQSQMPRGMDGFVAQGLDRHPLYDWAE